MVTHIDRIKVTIREGNSQANTYFHFSHAGRMSALHFVAAMSRLGFDPIVSEA